MFGRSSTSASTNNRERKRRRPARLLAQHPYRRSVPGQIARRSRRAVPAQRHARPRPCGEEHGVEQEADEQLRRHDVPVARGTDRRRRRAPPSRRRDRLARTEARLSASEAAIQPQRCRNQRSRRGRDPAREDADRHQGGSAEGDQRQADAPGRRCDGRHKQRSDGYGGRIGRSLPPRPVPAQCRTHVSAVGQAVPEPPSATTRKHHERGALVALKEDRAGGLDIGRARTAVDESIRPDRGSGHEETEDDDASMKNTMDPRLTGQVVEPSGGGARRAQCLRRSEATQGARGARGAGFTTGRSRASRFRASLAAARRTAATTGPLPSCGARLGDPTRSRRP